MASIRCPAAAVARLAQTRTACASLHHRCSSRPTARLLHVAAVNSIEAHNKGAGFSVLPLNQLAWISHRHYTDRPKGTSASGSGSSESGADDNDVDASGSSEDTDGESVEESDDESEELVENIDEEEITDILEDEGVCTSNIHPFVPKMCCCITIVRDMWFACGVYQPQDLIH